MSHDYQHSVDAVDRSKICARNYADKEVSEEVIQHLLYVAAGGPYKQGRRYFDLYAITNAEKCNAIWKHTARPDEENALIQEPKVNKDGTPTTFVGNAQVLAPVLFVFAACDPTPDYPEEEFWDPTQTDIDSEEEINSRFAMGTGMGMLVLEANRQGLHTGNCVCFDPGPITSLLKEWSGRDDFNHAGLMVGAGYPVEEWANKDKWVNKGTERDPEYPDNPTWQMRLHPTIAIGGMYEPPQDDQRDDPKTYRVF